MNAIGRRKFFIGVLGAVLLQATVASAQQAGTPTPDVTGTPSSDIILTSANSPVLPLRHGNVVPQSERVLLNGQALQSGIDYSMEYAGGVLYLTRNTLAGQAVTVTYRYSKTATTTGPMLANGINSFQLGLLPGALTMRLGFGLADRTQSGAIMRSNIFGFNTSSKFHLIGNGGGTLNGILLLGQREGVTSESDLGSGPNTSGAQHDSSRMIVQNLQSKVGAGTFSASYQDVSKNFTGFSAAQGSGYDDKALGQFQKEAGLKRMGVGLADLPVGSLKLTESLSQVKDGNNAISWQNFGLKQGPLAFNWSSQAITSGFSRFGDLAEANHGDLQRETGTKRDNASLGFNVKGLGVTATDFNVTDQGGNHLQRHDVALALKNGTVNYGDSTVGSSFAGFGNLLDPEKATYGADAGLKRKWANAKFDFGHGAQPLTLSDYSIKSSSGYYHATDFGFGGKTWNFGYADHGSDKGFGSFGSLAQADVDANINAIGAMYTGVKPNAPAERGAFGTTAGLDRKGYTLNLTPNKLTSFTADSVDLNGVSDKAKLDAFSLTSGGLATSYKYEDVGAQFAEINNLMGFEKTILGPLEGLKKTDFSLVDTMSHGRVLTINQMLADTASGGAARDLLEFKNRQLDVVYQSRSVDPTFAAVGQLNDPQAGLLGGLIGFKQTDTKIGWAPGSGVTYAGEYATSHDATTGVSTTVDGTNIGFVRKGTTFSFVQNTQLSTNPTQTILQNNNQVVDLKQSLGNWTFHAAHDKVDYAGTQEVTSTGSPLQSYTSDVVGLSLQVSKTTSVASELTSTAFANGQMASMRTDSVSTALSPRAGITVSNTQIDNNADQKVDETKRNYGFWYDITKGLRVSYGYIRDLNAADASGASTLNSVFSVGAAPAGLTGDSLAKVTQGNFGNLALGGGYAANQWMTPNASTGIESTRTQSFSNIRINNVKPFKIGPLTELKFNVNTDTATDNFTWIRQNQEFGFTGKFGANAYGYDYHSQVDSQNEHSADRTFTFTTDPKPDRFVTGSVLYKIRTLPAGKQAMIRNFDLKFHLTPRLTLSNQLQTNPEVANASVILGSVTQGTQVNRYKADFASTKDLSFGGSWEELKNTANNSYAQTTSANVTLFSSKSPVLLTYGWQAVNGNVPHQDIQRWSVSFDQKAGPNQSFNFLVGSLSYSYLGPYGQPLHGMTAQISYQLHL